MGSVYGSIHACEGRRKKYKEGTSPILVIRTLRDALYSPLTIYLLYNPIDLFANENVKPQRMALLMLQIDNPHPHKENKFSFI